MARVTPHWKGTDRDDPEISSPKRITLTNGTVSAKAII